MPTAYEKEREANMARNRALLEELQLDKGGATFLGMPEKPAPVPPFKKRRPVVHQKNKKRKTPPPSDSGAESETPPSRVRKVATEVEGGLRRSSRNAGKTVNYEAEIAHGLPKIVTKKVGVDHDTEPNRRSGKRAHDPKTFGSIPGIAVGTWWETREDCSNDAIHAPWVAGISGSPEGAYSVALSGGYEDDIDLGEAFTFTGSGGRDLKGTKNAPKNLRTAPQSADQSFENPFNKALKISSETKKPVRVIRGFKLKSPFAPVEGYRYDGLYTVEKAWMERGLNPKGFLVCKFAFKRVPGQKPLVLGDAEGAEAEDEEDAFSDADDTPSEVQDTEDVSGSTN
ncbi:hypothetical protein BV25DRAFT_3 [Artomyces pyxidatus]|uniref:Uncharacterized protein n=1 Tax=Artomyces pyxidatus TaxID=48021 RepID=A0ACB8TJA9_9AGAM|nr:hypothetical protein BV25DRAFT_3 [Artomyces pyxidatus]